MKLAIELIFDEESQNKINNIRNILNSNGVHDEAVKINHISIADVETNDKEKLCKVVEKFSKEFNSFDVTLSMVGSFMSSENVLFYSPTMNEKLLQANELITSLLYENEFECNKYYLKDNWVPHCTVGIRLSDKELKLGLGLLKDNNILPLKCRCEKIDILDYSNKPNYKQIVVYDLK